MSGDAVTASAPGFYGKIPSRGDFVSRRLPREFITRWDAWLQQGMRDFQARHGEAWLRYYLDAPVWRFALAPGVCTKEAWAGILMPSVDRVGRHFPLTIAQAIEQAASVNELLGQADWFTALEALALEAVADACDLDDLDKLVLQHRILAVGTLESLMHCCGTKPRASTGTDVFIHEEHALFELLGTGSDRAWWWINDSSTPELVSATNLTQELLHRLLTATSSQRQQRTNS